MKYLGTQLLNYKDGGFALPFEAVSILLLAAMIGCITIAFRTKPLSNSVQTEKKKVTKNI
jgi:NADH-quinone oxidoreductase subunit J